MGLSATLLFRLSVRWGHRLVLVGAALLYLCYPLLNAVARDRSCIMRRTLWAAECGVF
ncbi:hypothetical protein EMGBS1_06370 [Chloroflexota bacterium]|nr:hypothetical protein EMGBS1_06370 [Chloroflexota bacterium]